ncbi:fungal-specific transcription factor domain-containing protein [Dendryphion nanum]|uniref:Fungal-specific transcription factor domain-containing protein n=1 Tax=Dendryphion nanum TaxID=256645 RepID=A0A9P9IAJ3_9PLEO|nr:fungal-specific transcription factor domain-containing protein [Dendryphion nanum]
MSNRSPEPIQDESNGSGAQTGPESLACNGCRKAKLRCSRDRPSCVHCRRTGLGCVYETKRVKPGLKAGAVEHLHRRLDALEKIVHEREGPRQPITAFQGGNNVNTSGITQNSAAHQILTLLASELPKLINGANEQTISLTSERIEGTSKRRRFGDNNDASTGHRLAASPSLPDPDSLDAIIAEYFLQLHPWIPMIHEARFRQRLSQPRHDEKLTVVLHSMVLAASKYVSGDVLSRAQLEDTRRWVIWKSMENIFLESLQALIIVAYTDIGDGNSAKAWSIIGSLTRTVEYSQLTQENEDRGVHPFCQPYSFLEHTEDWTEKEERRRVFWNVFNLDRFCSISMGWNTSLTSDDVHRRLPCDGHLWRKRSPVLTPYFGIWDKSAARIGNPIAFLPHYASPGQPATESETQHSVNVASPESPAQNLMNEMSTVGAFAYCIEATESLSRTTSYFLQQKININDQRDINSWLTRFKELDLRLVHWKMLLPQKWKTNMERQSTLMDPNLTTAHVTHNASMILLHQLIAYPPIEWHFRNRLPSAWSADACLSAGTEIAKITQNYLLSSRESSPVGNQYAFCVFIAARVLLVHWRYLCENEPVQEFWSLVQSLEEMSKRWTALGEPFPRDHDLSAKYAARLKSLYDVCSKDKSYRINVTGYTNEIDHLNACGSRESKQDGHSNPSEDATAPMDNHWSRDYPSLSRIVPQIPMSTQSIHNTDNSGIPGPPTTNNNGTSDILHNIESADLSVFPQIMMDQHFMDMDRIITFDDGSMFTATLDHSGW